MSPGEALKAIRTEAGVSRADLAAMAGFSKRAIEQYEQRGRLVAPSWETLIRFSLALEIDIEEVLDRLLATNANRMRYLALREFAKKLKGTWP